MNDSEQVKEVVAALQAKVAELEAELAARAPPPTPPSPPANSIGLKPACPYCGHYHQPGQCSLCPACRHPSGLEWISLAGPTAACGVCGARGVVEISRPPIVSQPRGPRMPLYNTDK